jgi:CRP-like cAMP-binding protein
MEMVLAKGVVFDASANGLLAALPEASRERLFAKTQRVSLSVGDILYHPGGPITSVYFPLTCVISMMTEMKNGATIEIATVGKEGVLGIPAFWE